MFLVLNFGCNEKVRAIHEERSFPIIGAIVTLDNNNVQYAALVIDSVSKQLSVIRYFKSSLFLDAPVNRPAWAHLVNRRGSIDTPEYAYHTEMDIHLHGLNELHGGQLNLGKFGVVSSAVIVDNAATQ